MPEIVTYKISRNEDNVERITCLICNMTSYHPQDIKHKYCGMCHDFHSQLRLRNLPFFDQRKKTFVSKIKKVINKLLTF